MFAFQQESDARFLAGDAEVVPHAGSLPARQARGRGWAGCSHASPGPRRSTPAPQPGSGRLIRWFVGVGISRRVAARVGPRPNSAGAARPSAASRPRDDEAATPDVQRHAPHGTATEDECGHAQGGLRRGRTQRNQDRRKSDDRAVAGRERASLTPCRERRRLDPRRGLRAFAQDRREASTAADIVGARHDDGRAGRSKAAQTDRLRSQDRDRVRQGSAHPPPPCRADPAARPDRVKATRRTRPLRARRLQPAPVRRALQGQLLLHLQRLSVRVPPATTTPRTAGGHQVV